MSGNIKIEDKVESGTSACLAETGMQLKVKFYSIRNYLDFLQQQKMFYENIDKLGKQQFTKKFQVNLNYLGQFLALLSQYEQGPGLSLCSCSGLSLPSWIHSLVSFSHL